MYFVFITQGIDIFHTDLRISVKFYTVILSRGLSNNNETYCI